MRDSNKHMALFTVRTLLQQEYRKHPLSPTMTQALVYIHLSAFERAELVQHVRLASRSKYDPIGVMLTEFVTLQDARMPERITQRNTALDNLAKCFFASATTSSSLSLRGSKEE